MQDMATDLVILGILFAGGLAAHQIGRQTRVPRVTLLLICGLVVGEAGIGLISENIRGWYEFLSVTALTMVSFVLGSALSRDVVARQGRLILVLSVSVVLVTVALVSAGLYLFGMPAEVALLLGAIAAATDPAATQDVIRQSGIRNRFTDTLSGVVAIDDAWGLIVFSAVLALVAQGGDVGQGGHLLDAARDILGSVALGLLIGFPAAYLTGRLTDGEPLQVEALALVFLTSGVALMLDLSYLISGMTVGTVIANFARHHSKAFHEIEHIQWPFMVLFFILAGAVLDPAALLKIGGFGAAFVVLRVLSRAVGGWIGGRFGGATKSQGHLFGIALLPQAGVAIGMALVATNAYPAQAETIMALTIGSTVVFELTGPLAAMWAIRRTGSDGPAD